MALDKLDISKIMGPVEGNSKMTVSLFVVSSKSPRLKMLDLNSPLSAEKRAEKLRKWAEGHRLVAVIEAGDQVFAHANERFAAQLAQQHDLSINGKKVTVKALSDEQYEQLALVDAAFEEYVKQHPIDEAKDLVEKSPDSQHEIRQYLATHRLVSDQTFVAYLVAKMQNLSDEIILNCLRKMAESNREVARRRKEAEKKREILKEAIEREILKEEILTYEIKQDELRADAARINRTRGG